MKVVIDINDNEYEGIKSCPDNVTSYPWTIHLYDAVRKGIPLESIANGFVDFTNLLFEQGEKGGIE